MILVYRDVPDGRTWLLRRRYRAELSGCFRTASEANAFAMLLAIGRARNIRFVDDGGRPAL